MVRPCHAAEVVCQTEEGLNELARIFISSGRAYVGSDLMSVTTSNGPNSADAMASVVRKREARASASVTAGMSDAEFEAWLAAQGAVPMSEERRRSLNLGGNSTE